MSNLETSKQSGGDVSAAPNCSACKCDNCGAEFAEDEDWKTHLVNNSCVGAREMYLASNKSPKPRANRKQFQAGFEAGWNAAMLSIWERLPLPDFASDPMTPREVATLIRWVKSNLPNKGDQPLC